MKRILSTIFVLFFLVLAGNASASLASYTYTLDIDIPDPDMITEISSRVAGVEFQVAGGDYGDSWAITLGNAVPSEGNWIFENFGSWNAVYDDYNWSDPDYAPMLSGNILSITSNVELSFSDMGFYDYQGKSVDPEYFSTDGFSQSAVPIPGSLILLGSGLLGFLGFKRKK